jgi:hypothetical protein
MNREQVKNALTALGLDPAKTVSLAIWNDRMVWETVDIYEDHNDYVSHEAQIDE